MNTWKNWWQSKTMLGILAAGLVWALRLFDVEIGSAAASEIIYRIGELVGLVLAAFGRVTAEKRIKRKLM